MAGDEGAGKSSGAESQPPGPAIAGSSRLVFISYASHDAAIAQKACSALETAGILCWIAPRDVVPGSLYADGIVGAIDESRILVLILSKNAVASAHVGRELERTASKRHPIIALRTDAAPLNRAFEYFLNQSQWIEAGAGNTDAAIAKLVEAVKQHLSAAPSQASQAPGHNAATSRRAWGMAAALVILALVAGYFLLRSLHGQGTPAARATRIQVVDKSIAVLPFVDLSEAKDKEYFADGMSEEIIDLLTKIPGLTVIGRTSSFEFKGRNEDVRTIGAKLNAAYVLEGSVRNSADQLRISAQLINTKTGTHEWSETYDRRIGDVLKLQDAIAAAVVREMQLTVGSANPDSRATLKSTEAYDLLLRARHSADRWDKDGLDEAISLLNQALALDPTFAEAAAELAYTYEKQEEAGYMLPTPASLQARHAAKRAISLDPRNPLGHAVLGRVHLTYDWDWAAADREFRYVSSLAPGNADALHGEALLSLAFGRWDEALVQIKAALARDPLDSKTWFDLAEIQFRRGHLTEAEAGARRALEIRPTFPWAHWLIGLVKLWGGDRDGALIEIQKEPTDEGKQIGLGMVYHALGKKADSDAAVARMIKDQADGNAYGIAEVYAYRGQSDEAMHWLERSYTQKEPFLFFVETEMAPTMPADDPQFKAFLRKMNLPE
jgi:TolB-like protein/Flp pilus assembly protein TadD